MLFWQAAENALKATQLAYDAGLKDNDHVLTRLCNAVKDAECESHAQKLESLTGGYYHQD